MENAAWNSFSDCSTTYILINKPRSFRQWNVADPFYLRLSVNYFVSYHCINGFECIYCAFFILNLKHVSDFVCLKFLDGQNIY